MAVACPERSRERTVNLTHSFYKEKSAQCCLKRYTSDRNEFKGQGCCSAPLLFNVLLSAVMEDWESKQPDELSLRHLFDGI